MVDKAQGWGAKGQERLLEVTVPEGHQKVFSCFTYMWNCFHSRNLLVSTRIISIFSPEMRPTEK